MYSVVVGEVEYELLVLFLLVTVMVVYTLLLLYDGGGGWVRGAREHPAGLGDSGVRNSPELEIPPLLYYEMVG